MVFVFRKDLFLKSRFNKVLYLKRANTRQWVDECDGLKVSYITSTGYGVINKKLIDLSWCEELPSQRGELYINV